MIKKRIFDQGNNGDFVVILVGRVIYILLMVLSINIMTKTLSEDGIGNYYLILAFVFFFTTGLISPIGSYVSRNINIWKTTHNVINALVVYVFYGFLVSIIAVIVAFFIIEVFNYPINNSTIKLYAYIFLSVFIGNAHHAIMGLSNIIGFRNIYIRFLILTVLLGLIFAITLSRILDSNALNWLYGFLLSEVLLITFVVRELAIKLNDSVNLIVIKNKLLKTKYRTILVYSAPLFVVCVLTWTQNYSYRFIVEFKYGLETLALIGLGFSIAASIMSAVESITSQYLNPIFYQNIASSEKKERMVAFKSNINSALPIYLLTAFFIVGLAPILTKILVDQRYYNAYWYLSIGAIIELFKVFVNHSKLIFYSEYKNTVIIMPVFLSALLSIALLSFIELNNKYIFIGLILLSSFFIYAISIYFAIKKIMKEKLLNRKVLVSVMFLGSFLLTALYFNDEKDFNITNNMIVLSIYGIFFVMASIYITRNISLNQK